MKKRFLTLLPLLVASLSGCYLGAHDYYLVIDEKADWNTYIVGSDFDATGLEVGLYCRNHKKEHKVLKLKDLEFENDKELKLDQTSITIKSSYGDIEYPISVKEKYHIACVGDSLTAGHMWPNESYPTYLGQYVSDKYSISNCGENGISITGYGGNSIKYIERPVYQQSIDFAPDIFAIMLGTNDATGWANAEATFVEDYHYLLDTYIEMFPNAKFIMMVSPPVVTPNQFGIPNDTIRDEVNPVQRDLADEYGFELLDLREEFEETENYQSKYLRPNNDNVHFTKEGAQYVASRVWDIVQELTF